MKNKMKLNNIQKLLIGITVLTLIYIIYNNYYHKNMEGFAVCDNTTEYIGNPLIKRDGSNLTYNPALPSGQDGKTAILGYGNLTGWEGNKDDELIVRFDKPKSLKSIIIGGYGKFKIQVEILDPKTKVRTWKQLKDTNSTKTKTVNGATQAVTDIFEGGNPNVSFNASQQRNSSCYNLNVDGDNLIVCQAIKIKVVDIARCKAQFEILGLDVDANPEYRYNENLNTYAKLYDENNKEINKTGNDMLTWLAESNNSDPKCIVKFETTDAVPIINKLITYVEFEPNGNTWITEFNIAFKYHGSDVTRHINNIPGNSGIATTTRFYFKYPLLASELIIKPSTSTSYNSSVSSSNRPACKIKLFGKSINSESQENTLKAEQDTYYQINKSRGIKSTCPPVSSLINKQAEIQQLCDAMEQSEEIELEKKKIDTNKMYQLKLARQRKEIKELQQKINSMRDSNKHFNDIEDRNKMAMFKYQEELDNKLKDLVKKRLDNQSAFNLNLAVKDPNNKANNTVEGFTNYSSAKISNHFTNRKTQTPPEHFYEEFVGSHYFN